MRKLAVLFAVILFAVFGIADIIHDFIDNDPFHYFLAEPDQLIVVAGIAFGGGLAAVIFYRLSPNWQRRVNLLTLGSAAGFVTVYGVYLGYEFARLSILSGYSLVLAFLGIAMIAALLWFEFYQVFRRSVL